MPNVEKPSASEAPKGKGCLAVVMALGLALLVFAALFVLTSGAIAPAAVAGGIIFGVAAFHYVVWGWWLSGIIRQQVEDEEQQ
ncbi:MAG TPA: hypothetical protein VFI31_10845 [Pirellulales bacterium]|nr:hypothetical protein [Pirellulales bacterium]